MAPVVAKRRFNIVKSVFRAAVNCELLDVSPMARITWAPPRDSVAVDVALLPSVKDVLEIADGCCRRRLGVKPGYVER